MKKRFLYMPLLLGLAAGFAQADMQHLTDDDLQIVTGQNDLNQSLRPRVNFESLTIEQITESERFQNLSADQQTYLTENFESLQTMTHEERIETLSAQGFPEPQHQNRPDFSTLTLDDVTSSNRFQNLSDEQQDYMTDNFDSLQSMSRDERHETLQAQGFPEPPRPGGMGGHGR